MKRRNPFPGVTRVVDRHGKVRWRFRKKDRPSLYLPGEYNSAEFRAAYEQAVTDKPIAATSTRFAHGTFNWLIEHYKRTPTWMALAPITRRNLANSLERFQREHGDKTVAGLRQEHVEVLIGKKAETPAAANQYLKLLRRLCRFAMRRGVIATDPTVGVQRYAENPDGFHTWSELEITQFERHHGIESKAVLALRLMLSTGASRQDAAAMGWQNVRDGRISYRRRKTGQDVDLPILSDLQEVLALVPADRMLFITHNDRPYKATTYGNWFHVQCLAAGLRHCSAHGLRKAGATRLANEGASEHEIMSFLGHRTPDEARTYTRAMNRRHLADTGMARLERAKEERVASNPVERLDNHRSKSLKTKEN